MADIVSNDKPTSSYLLSTSIDFLRKQMDSILFNKTFWNGKLEKFFGGMPVSPGGMFYYAHMDKTCKKLMEKSNVIWTKGSSMGDNDDFGRFNIGQDVKLLKNAVKIILKTDKIK